MPEARRRLVRQATPGRLPLVRRRDFERIAVLLVLLPLAWLLPSRLWLAACERLVAGVMWLVPPLARKWERSEFPLGLVEADVPWPRLVGLAKGLEWFSFMVFLGEHRPWGWRPRITLIGRERIDASLARGNGAVLWVVKMGASDLIVKRGLSEAGYQVVHLSRAGHGPGGSGSRAARLLNPVQTRVERRYLRERVVIDSGTTGPLRSLRRHLEKNHVVSITATRSARRLVRVPFLQGEILVPGGPPELAHAAGCDLLPVFTRQIGPTSFEVIVSGPLDLRASDDDLATVAAKQLGALLEPVALQDPVQWLSWARSLALLPFEVEG